ncbi:MAG: autotransporter outer membrane beta-barrel domain-containing protein [Desulfovibrio sp.]|uniref:autotransporter family protein n=1 Tax=Desulfovibrio sp. TaxID=885 RepID=UPI00258776F0|nr:autotransporter outer membrane beta-barrel domain-containing protein [Desulfovibrio sp.]MCD7984622.1 autotransporter outer membrane beta-barrel domain-containing protein [Desulfovibrio sp.]
MQLSQGSLGMLLKRYRAVLKKCRFLNVMGGAILIGAFALGISTNSQADTILKNAAEWETWRQSAQTLNQTTGQVKVESPESFTIDVNDFVTSTPTTHQIQMEDYGRISSKGTVILSGTSLQLGTTKFSENNPSGIESTIKANSIELQTNTNLFSLTAGKLYVTGDGPAAGYYGKSELKIGDGTGSLQIQGGSLRLGNSDPSKLNMKEDEKSGKTVDPKDYPVEGGTIRGTIRVGSSGSTIDSEMNVASGEWSMYGNLTVEKSGVLSVGNSNTEGGTPLLTSLKVDGKLVVNGGKVGVSSRAQLSSTGVDLAANTTIQVNENSILHIGKLTGNASSTVNVGDTQGSGVFIASNISMNGGPMNFDPPFIAAGDTSNASMGGLQFSSNSVDALLNVGRNSMVSLASTDAEWLRTEVARYQNDGKGLWGQDITAALAIRTPQTLNTVGGIQVDGTWVHGGAPTTANNAIFADKSLLVVDAAGVGSQVALSSTAGVLKTDAMAKLHIAGGQGGQTVNIVSGFTDPATSFNSQSWTDANLTTSTALLSATGGTFDATTGAYSVKLTSNAAAEVFPKLSSEVAALVDQMALKPGVDVNSSYAGVRFLSRALSDKYIGTTNSNLAASTVESAARMAVVGGVPQLTWATNNAAGNAVTQRTTLARPTGNGVQAMAMDGSMQTGASAGDAAKTGFAMWVMPLYQSWNGFGLEGGNFDLDLNGSLGGVAIGADYTFAEAIRAGITFNIGGGYAEGSGDFNKTTNNMNFWGIGAYLGWTPGNFGLTADVNYTSTYNELEQELPSGMQMRDLKSDARAYAISAGLRGEYKVETSVLDIIPHVGVRYTSLNTDEYDVKSGGTILKGDAINQNIWTFPVGVAFSKEIEMGNGWHFKPSLDLAVIPAAGDIKARGDVRFTGVDRSAEVETQTMDYITYMGQAGLEFGNDTVSLGVNYNVQMGAQSTAHGVFGTFRYEF